ncbi:benzoate/H(+) symporter BenE family transporter [Tatumella sp. UCD-D_suzukii]|uniref:benzoate/H(+) symporter BenE family transporter n=1 Tax=Tatumella sp. UCD-D_suzukii TaxID=1408192 RepID=UPI00093C65D4|nr:benzoate/H(+) symporter BenE family transporter [Tatumella sp. UCD-D_suzukii]
MSLHSRLPAITLPMVISGAVAVLVGYASSAAIIFQAARAAGADTALTGSWLGMLGVGMGITSFGLSLRYRMPILTAWSTPGAAMLATSLNGVSLSDTIGLFIFTNLLIVICGVSGVFSKLMRYIPASIASAMLAGILLHFGLQTFSGLQQNLPLCLAMCLSFLLARRWSPRYAVFFTLLTGALVIIVQGQTPLSGVSWHLSAPVFISPSINLPLLLGVGLPYFLVSMASQNAPGIATLNAHGYPVPVSQVTTITGAVALLLSPFGGFSVCIAAITAAICMGEDVHPQRNQRWIAAAIAGLFYLVTGAFGSAIALLFSTLPPVFIHTVAGLALLTPLAASLHRCLERPEQRDTAIVTFLITASGVSVAGIGPAFWGMIGGGLCHIMLSRRVVTVHSASTRTTGYRWKKPFRRKGVGHAVKK